MSPDGHPTVNILDCTIRDGSYAVDFKFTANDAGLLCALLSRVGFRYIEVGHGIGLGASAAGKGQSASSDVAVIAEARKSSGAAKVGAFYIPGIGSRDDLESARAAGLDFVRVGCNADEVEKAFGDVTFARSLGLVTCLNFMKTYGITPAAFGERCRSAQDAGAEVVYIVDSAGGMLPEEVGAYVSAARERVEIAVGFHGHSNLHLAVANSVAAVRSGATFIDTSLYGIGRSSGNTPSEVLVAVLARMGIETGVDLFGTMEIADGYLRPLMEQIHLHDMTAVALGYGRFHSSYLPQVQQAAEQYGVDVHRLIVALGQHDPMRVTDDAIVKAVQSLPAAPKPVVTSPLGAFSAPRFSRHSIRNTAQAVSDLVDGLTAVAAKGRLQAVLDLASFGLTREEGHLLAEFVLQDRFMVLGRIRYGALDTLGEALRACRDQVQTLLLDVHLVPPDARAALAECVAAAAPAATVIPYDSGEMEAGWLAEATIQLLRPAHSAVAVFGELTAPLLARLRVLFDAVIVEEPPGEWAVGEGAIVPASAASDRHVNVVIARDLPAERALLSIRPLVCDGAWFLYAGTEPLDRVADFAEAQGWRPVLLARDEMYRDQLPRWMAIWSRIRVGSEQPARAT